jgi:3-oxoadipyl-CoA thiolase
MTEAVIIDAVRSPIGRYGGALKEWRPDDLVAHVIKRLIARNPTIKDKVEDVILGCANQAGEDNRNLARMAALLAGLPVDVAAVTVNRLCGSGLEAINQASQAISANAGDIFIAGGVESMTRAPLVFAKPEIAFPRGNQTIFDTTIGWRFINEVFAAEYPPYTMGETAEHLAQRFAISREEQDAFALRSQEKWALAQAGGLFEDELVPVSTNQHDRQRAQAFCQDEHPRPQSNLAKLAGLPPVFKKNGTVTAGNSSGISDGAACLLLTAKTTAEKMHLAPMATVLAHAVAGVDPAYMGIGPVPATLKALRRANLSINDIDLIELNEAFAAQALACIQELGLDINKVNVNGGAIAMGHPIGCSGARIMTTLLHEMKRRKAKLGLATMCIGVGQGVATVVSLN